MKKLLILLFISFCNYSYADITIWCSGDYSKGLRSNITFNEKINTILEVLITDQKISFPNENQNEYPSVLREKKYEKEGLVYSGSIMFSNLDFYDYNIDRTTGRLSIKIVKYQTIYDSYYNCSPSKPKTIF